MATLLDSLHTPSLSYFSVTVVHHMPEGHVLLSAAIARKTVSLPQFMTVTLSVADSYCAFSVRTYCDVCQRTTDPEEDSTSGWLRRHDPVFEYQGWDVVASLPDLCRLLPFQDAEALLLNCDLPLNEKWLDLAACMESVVELRLYSVTVQVTISPGDFMKQVASAGTGEGPIPFVMPSLHALTMDGKSLWGPLSAGESETAQTTVAEMHAQFTQRAQEGAGIHTLRILGAPMIWKKALEKLQEVVPCVEFDGYG